MDEVLSFKTVFVFNQKPPYGAVYSGGRIQGSGKQRIEG
jgi:hypothetical protein